MYLTKNEKMFVAYLIHGWGESGFGDSYLWDDLTPEQLESIQWLFEGRDTLQEKLKAEGLTNDVVVDRMGLPEDLSKNFR